MSRSKLAVHPLGDPPQPTEGFRVEAERLELQQAVEAAEAEITAGHWVEHSEVLSTLKRWAGEG
jgi:predicted transcriptional regulator